MRAPLLAVGVPQGRAKPELQVALVRQVSGDTNGIASPCLSLVANASYAGVFLFVSVSTRIRVPEAGLACLHQYTSTPGPITSAVG